jgi:hypothetical protein
VQILADNIFGKGKEYKKYGQKETEEVGIKLKNIA